MAGAAAPRRPSEHAPGDPTSGGALPPIAPTAAPAR
eukprot:gene3571-62573_t